MTKRALVTGATGFIGQHLVLRLLETRWQVSVLCRPGATAAVLEDTRVRRLEGDVTRPDSVLAACADAPDAVFHLAANTSTSRRDAKLQDRVNIAGTQHVIEAVRSSGAGRLVHTSSVSVHGFGDGIITDATPLDPSVRWINYCRSKADAEREVMAAVENGLNAVIVSPAHVMGPLDTHNWIRMIRMIDEGTLPGIPPGSGSFADVREVARAFEAAATTGGAGEKYLLGGPHASFLELTGMLADALEVPLKARPMPAWLMRAIARIRTALAHLRGREPELTPEATAFVCGHEYCDSGKARKMLGYRETPLDELVRDTVAWYRSELA